MQETDSTSLRLTHTCASYTHWRRTARAFDSHTHAHHIHTQHNTQSSPPSICYNRALAHGFEAFSPLDSEVDIAAPSILSTIFSLNIDDIDKADAVVANCAPFRGQCVDDGTAFELGVAFAKGVPIVAYTPHAETTVKDRLDAAFADPSLAALYDQETFPRSEDFPGANDAVDALQRPGPVNIMITEAIRKQGGFIGGSFEECLVHLQGLGRQEGERE